MAARLASRLTPEEYLAIEREAEFRSEYLNGEMFAMAGASTPHTDIVCNIIYDLVRQLRGTPYRPLAQDHRVRTSLGGLYTYPDVIIACGELQYADTHFDTLLNPLVLMEVLSPSTERYDRGEKFLRYEQIESLQEYVLISQDQARFERYIRHEEGWLYTQVVGLESNFQLKSVNCTFALADVYDRIEFARTDDRVAYDVI